MDGHVGQSVAKRHGAAATATAEEDPVRHEAAEDEDDGDKKATRQGSRRVASLDVFRGLTVAVSSVPQDEANGSRVLSPTVYEGWFWCCS